MINKNITHEIIPSSPTLLEERLGYDFNNKNLLIESLTHPSVKQRALKNNNKQKNYERLELLGDSILNFLVTEILFKSFSEYDEGQLAKIKAYAVSKDVLCLVAAKINLSSYIIMTYGEEISGGRNNPNNIENTMEALIAAIYLDSNIDIIRNMVASLWLEFISIIDLANYDPKTTLQELAQSHGQGNKPVYELVKREGAAHSSIFTIMVKIPDHQQLGYGQSVKEAEKDAARKLLIKLGELSCGSLEEVPNK